MTRTRWPIVYILMLVSAAGCQPPERTLHNLVLTGSSGMEPLMRDIGKRFEAAHPDVRVDVQAGGSTRGVTDARQGLADIGMVARALKPDETSLHATPIARDGVCIIVNRTNPVPSLNDDQIVRIYTRGVSNWKQVGGPERSITLIHMSDGRAILELFLDHFKLKSTQILPRRRYHGQRSRRPGRGRPAGRSLMCPVAERKPWASTSRFARCPPAGSRRRPLTSAMAPIRCLARSTW